MKHLSSIVLAAAVLAAGAVACFKDPTSSLRNGPSRILLTHSSVFLNVGDSLQIQAEVKDEQGNTFDASDAAWTTSDATIAVVNADTTKVIPYNAFSRAFVRAEAAGKAVVHFTSHGITDSIQVVGMPLAFVGTVAHVAAPTPRDTITINATAALTFTATGADTSVVTVGDSSVLMISRSASQLKFLAPVASDATIKITNLSLLNGLVTMGSLNATTKLTVTNPELALTLYQDFYGTLTPSNSDQYNAVTSTTADSIRIEISWADPTADVDGYFLDATGANYCELDSNCAMASSNNPETVDVRLLPGTPYYIEAYLYAAGNMSWLNYRIRTIKIQ